MIMTINSEELKQFIESKPLPAAIKRFAKSNTIRRAHFFSFVY